MSVRKRLRVGTAGLLALPVVAAAPARAATGPCAWVVGANDGSLTRVELDTGIVHANAATVGTVANRITVDPGGSFALVVCSGTADVHVLDPGTASVAAVWGLPAGSNPWDAEIAGNRAFVTSLLTDAVFVLDTDDGSLLATVPVGVAPQGMCVADGRLWVANTGFDFDSFTFGPGSVSVLDPVTFAVLAEIPVHTNPQECTAGPDGRVHVTCTGDFGGTTGRVDVIDPATDAVVATLPVPAYPGTAALGAPLPAMYLGVTTTSFSSAVLAYDPFSLAWIADVTDPLLPSFDFYGNLRTSPAGQLLVADFAADLLLVETPSAPGSPAAYLVGDGPVDIAVVDGDTPVGIALSGLSAVDGRDGVRLAWHATPELGVAGFTVERQAEGDAARVVAADVPVAREVSWTDRSAPCGPRLTWRVIARDAAGTALDEAAVSLVRRCRADGPLGIRAIAPNPARGRTRIDFDSPARASAALEIVDVTGRRVLRRELGVVERGPGSTAWDGRDDVGRPASPGLYLVRLAVGDASATSRVLMLR